MFYFIGSQFTIEGRDGDKKGRRGTFKSGLKIN